MYTDYNEQCFSCGWRAFYFQKSDIWDSAMSLPQVILMLATGCMDPLVTYYYNLITLAHILLPEKAAIYILHHYYIIIPAFNLSDSLSRRVLDWRAVYMTSSLQSTARWSNCKLLSASQVKKLNVLFLLCENVMQYHIGWRCCTVGWKSELEKVAGAIIWRDKQNICKDKIS